jgi:adenine phosphoribosyltransferase
VTRYEIGFIDGHADVWALFRDPAVLRGVVEDLAEPFRGRVTRVVGIESRGFLLGAAVALILDAGFVAIRKESGLFPGPKLTAEAGVDYRGNRHTLRIQRESLGAGDRVVLVDDWIETGSQARAARELVEGCGAVWIGISTVVNQATPDVLAGLGVARALVQDSELPEV